MQRSSWRQPDSSLWNYAAADTQAVTERKLDLEAPCELEHDQEHRGTLILRRRVRPLVGGKLSLATSRERAMDC